ncbi:MAG: hypothetical protein PQJ44_08910, partial [Sphaerochaetaceae bacterium]|nr:hypothetical protein [Sphaerochaetaceae bacterium]
MITTKKLFSALVALTMSIVMVSCAGEDGETGPAGPAGNANVQSNTYTIMPSDWSNGNATISVSGISESISNNGQVSVFFTFDSLGTDTITWNPLPYRFVGNVGGQNQFITLQNTISTGEVTISARLNNNGGVNFNS